MCDLRKEDACFLHKWGICVEKTRHFQVKWGICEEKTRDFRLNGGCEKTHDFRLNGGLAKRKHVIFG